MNKNYKILIILSTIVIAAYIGYDLFSNWHKNQIEQSKTAQVESYEKTIETLRNEISDLKKQILLSGDDPVPVEKITSIFGETVTDKLVTHPAGDTAIDCDSLKQGITSFFTYLDNRGYGEKYGLSDGTYLYYRNSLSELKKNPPEYSGTSPEVLALLRSMSHFYRVLGKNGTSLVRDILVNEPEVIEPGLALLFEQLSTANDCNNETDAVPTIKTCYEYAHFFLNTIAGKSYLLRRSSKHRILVTYYSLLIIDQANKQTLNHYGFDISPRIDLLYSDIKNHRDLMFRDKYLESLNKISGGVSVR